MSAPILQADECAASELGGRTIVEQARFLAPGRSS